MNKYKFIFLLTAEKSSATINANQTVDAEIKAVVHAQRVREAESRIEMQAAKWTAEGAVKGRKAEYSAT